MRSKTEMMIPLTNANGDQFYINPRHIVYIEPSTDLDNNPYTTICCTCNTFVVAKETLEEVKYLLNGQQEEP